MPAPDPTKTERVKRRREGGSNQKLILFRRGKAISGAPIRRGTNQFPNPPMRTGIMKKKIMRSP